jgi:hypothetical protein
MYIATKYKVLSTHEINRWNSCFKVLERRNINEDLYRALKEKCI